LTKAAQERPPGNLQIHFVDRLEGKKRVRAQGGIECEAGEGQAAPEALDAAGFPVPTRITVQIDKDGYRFGAITGNAAIPERALTLDPWLVTEINDRLAAEANPASQLELGQLLDRLSMRAWPTRA